MSPHLSTGRHTCVYIYIYMYVFYECYQTSAGVVERIKEEGAESDLKLKMLWYISGVGRSMQNAGVEAVGQM